MSFANLNAVRTVKEGIETKGMDFKPLKDFCGQVVPVDGYFFSTSRYGKQTVVVGLGYLINLPAWATEKFEKIHEDPGMRADVLAGKLQLEDIKIIKTKNGTTCTFTFGDRA